MTLIQRTYDLLLAEGPKTAYAIACALQSSDSTIGNGLARYDRKSFRVVGKAYNGPDGARRSPLPAMLWAAIPGARPIHSRPGRPTGYSPTAAAIEAQLRRLDAEARARRMAS